MGTREDGGYSSGPQQLTSAARGYLLSKRGMIDVVPRLEHPEAVAPHVVPVAALHRVLWVGVGRQVGRQAGLSQKAGPSGAVTKGKHPQRRQAAALAAGLGATATPPTQHHSAQTQAPSTHSNHPNTGRFFSLHPEQSSIND